MQHRLKQERHEGALVLRPYSESTNASKASGETDRWLMKHGCFHFNKGLTSTHLKMAVADTPATFVNIPASLEVSPLITAKCELMRIQGEFLEVYANDDSANYLCEYATKVFRMFFDIDYEGSCSLSSQQTLWMAQVTRFSLNSHALSAATRPCRIQSDNSTMAVMRRC